MGPALRLPTCGAYNGGWHPQPRLQEATVDFNPDDAQQYLEGVEYPASKEDVVSAAENNKIGKRRVGKVGAAMCRVRW